MAPERPGALAAISRLVAAGVAVSLGHTEATAAQMRAAATAGARLVTHVFNAQSPLHHREPGAPGVALTDPRLFPCLIADGVHVDPAVLQIAFAACPRAVAVTDSLLVAGLAEGAEQDFGGAPVRLGPQGVGLRADGTLAGAGITLDEGIRRLIAAGVAPEVALDAATARPAEALGLADRGRLTPGARADLVWWGDDFRVRQVWTGAGTPAAAPTNGDRNRARRIVGPRRASPPRTSSAPSWPRSVLRNTRWPPPPLPSPHSPMPWRRGCGPAGGCSMSAPAPPVGSGCLTRWNAAPPSASRTGSSCRSWPGARWPFCAPPRAPRTMKPPPSPRCGRMKFSAADALVGIAASGTTPFTLAAVKHAAACGALTGAILNSPGAPLAQAAQIAVQIASGAEIIAGSTRLSAGSTQKIALNILSSTVMIRLGKTFGPYMVDVRATNEKLRRRAIRMTAKIAKVSEPAALLALEACEMHVKTAVVTLLLALSPQASGTAARTCGRFAAAGSERTTLKNNERS